MTMHGSGKYKRSFGMDGSDTNYNFLHGNPTAEPGSWCNDDVTCGNAACRAIVRKLEGSAVANDIELSVRQERRRCKTCAEERQSKALVAKSIRHRRFIETKFVGAPAIFAKNGITYETNRLRAKHYAHHRKERCRNL